MSTLGKIGCRSSLCAGMMLVMLPVCASYGQSPALLIETAPRGISPPPGKYFGAPIYVPRSGPSDSATPRFFSYQINRYSAWTTQALNRSELDRIYRNNGYATPW